MGVIPLFDPAPAFWCSGAEGDNYRVPRRIGTTRQTRNTNTGFLYYSGGRGLLLFLLPGCDPPV